MTNVEEAKTDYLKVKKSLEDCTKSIQELQAKTDQIQDSLPGLTRAVEDAGKAKESALDAFALSGNKQTESALKAARQAHETAQRAYAEGNELVEATHRALKRQESELVRLNTACELAKRQLWQAIADEIKTAIHSEVFENVQKLFVIGSQTGQTRQFILDSIFPNPSSGEHQEIFGQLAKAHGIE